MTSTDGAAAGPGDLPPGVLVARVGAGANCSSAGSAIDILFYTSVIAGAIAVALSAAFPPRASVAARGLAGGAPRRTAKIRAMTLAGKRGRSTKMSDWKEARVASIAPAADALVHVRLDVPAGVAASHVAPGQYVKVAVPAGESFYAIASRPNPEGHRIELLLKVGSAVSDTIAALPTGATVKVTAAQGRGFPLDLAAGRDLVLVATGSGISPIRSAVEAVARRRSDFGKVSLHVGARTPSAFPYVDDFSAWRASEIDVFPVVSRPQDTGWTGLTGYVQSHLSGVHFASAIAFLCGQRAMVEAVRKALAGHGMPPEAIHLNF